MGLRAAENALRAFADVIVSAPDRERSATSHSISLDRPLRADEEEDRPGVYAVDGTPADCVYLALLHLTPRKPDLVVSGINHGYNLGSDVFYSGTVAAAVEGALRGVPGIAVSLQAQERQRDFSGAGRFLGALVREVLGRGPGAIPGGTILNVNVPAGAVSGYEITFLGRRVYRDLVDARQDLRGRAYYWIGGPEAAAEDIPGSDTNAVQVGRVSVTPVGLELTRTALIPSLRTWSIPDFQHHVGTAEKVTVAAAETP